MNRRLKQQKYDYAENTNYGAFNMNPTLMQTGKAQRNSRTAGNSKDNVFMTAKNPK